MTSPFVLILALSVCSNLHLAASLQNFGGANSMSTNIERAVTDVSSFEKKGSIEDLRQAVNILEGVDINGKTSLESRIELRRLTLAAWLRLLNAIDGKMDPKFNPSDVPALSLVPPGPAGLQYPSGTKPEDIQDPVLRKQYEEMIEKNRKKSEAYALQTNLRRLNDRATPDATHFLQQFYTTGAADQKECKDAIAHFIKNPRRASELSHAVPHS